MVLNSASPSFADSTGFTKDSYKVYEFEEYVLLQVRAQSCCPGGQGQVDFSTSDVTAVAGRDYVHTAGTLLLAAGGTAIIRVPILNDVLVEDREQFKVTLTNFRGTFPERGSEKAVVNILDDDWTYPEPAPAIDEARPVSPPKPSAPVAGNPGPPTATETAHEPNHINSDVVAPSVEAAPVVPAREDEKGRSSSSNAAFLLIVFLTVAAVAFGFRR